MVKENEDTLCGDSVVEERFSIHADEGVMDALEGRERDEVLNLRRRKRLMTPRDGGEAGGAGLGDISIHGPLSPRNPSQPRSP